MVYRIGEELMFPNPRLADPDGLLAVGGDLCVDRLLLAYSHGIFPWFAFKDNTEPYWYCPMDRFVIFPEEIHISHSMRSLINKQRYQISMNQDFESVISNCSNLRINQPGAWLGKDMIDAYTELHRLGFAHSVEVYDGDRLVGGLYGICLDDGFYGESMFSLVPSASKLALIYLAEVLVQNGVKLIDCQFETPHLKSMGGRHISYDEYMKFIRPEDFGDFS